VKGHQHSSKVRGDSR